MGRKLKFHEKKLLKKHDFLNWSLDNNMHERKIMSKYRVTREAYTSYNKLSRGFRETARLIIDLDPKDPFRVRATGDLLEKLYTTGIIPTKENLELVDKVNASSFCRRRLPVIMVKQRMAQTLKVADQFIQQGHVRVGDKVVLDPAYLVTRNLEDFIQWKDNSKIKRHIQDYQGDRDDFYDC